MGKPRNVQLIKYLQGVRNIENFQVKKVKTLKLIMHFKMLQFLAAAVFLIVTNGTAVNAGVTRGDTPVDTKQNFIIEPDDIVAITGDHVQLMCQVTNVQAPCQWTKDGFGLGQDVELPAYPRYSLEHKDGACHLNIYPVLIKDEGEYQCQVADGDNSLTSRSARLTVNSQPGVPFIKQAKESDVRTWWRGRRWSWSVRHWEPNQTPTFSGGT